MFDLLLQIGFLSRPRKPRPETKLSDGPGASSSIHAWEWHTRPARSTAYPPGLDSTYVNRCFRRRKGVSSQRYETDAIATVSVKATKTRGP